MAPRAERFHNFPSTPAVVSDQPYDPDLIPHLADTVDAAMNKSGHRPVVTHEPDPTLAEDAGQFFTLFLLDHIEQCTFADDSAPNGCGHDTRLAVRYNDGESHDQQPYCNAHAHVKFADFLVGC